MQATLLERGGSTDLWYSRMPDYHVGDWVGLAAVSVSLTVALLLMRWYAGAHERDLLAGRRLAEAGDGRAINGRPAAGPP